MRLRFVLGLTMGALVACGGGDATPDASATVDAVPAGVDRNRDVVHTALAVDVGAMRATASITVAPAASTALTLEIGDLAIESVSASGLPLQWEDTGDLLNIGVPESAAPIIVDIAYGYLTHPFEGASGSYTLVWPYFCGNLFPCKSTPDDGLTFALELTGLPAGKTAIYPATIDAQAPSYMAAWAIDDYTRLDLGTTTAGTTVGMWHRASEAATAAAGGANLRQAFDWFEQELGDYLYGDDVATVSVNWGGGAFGGMEHHPLWHVGSAALGDEETNVHEAAHGWFGNGVRIACWEDFVLSEGTVTYLAGRALEVVAPDVGELVWQQYTSALSGMNPNLPVWPEGCNQIDILGDNLFTRAPYIRGAFFYRAVALRVGADVLDGALALFYDRHAGGAATMQDMLIAIEDHTGFDPTACADRWLRATTIPLIEACPE